MILHPEHHQWYHAVVPRFLISLGSSCDSDRFTTMKREGVHEEAGFIAPLPTKLPSQSRKPRKSGRRPNKGARAAADTPSEHESESSLAQNKAALERSFGLQLEAKDGKSGKCTCIWCNGTRERRCSWCEGRGVRYEMGHTSWEQLASDMERMQADGEPQPFKLPERIPVRCSACGGSRKLRCAYCRGSGIGSYGYAH